LIAALTFFITQNRQVIMNRLVLDTEDIFATDSLAPLYDTHPLATLDCSAPAPTEVAAHATFTPIHYEPNYAYPLLVWLHGHASNEHELRQVMPQVSMRNYVAVAPQGPWRDSRHRGRHGWRQASDMIEVAAARIAECIASSKRRFNIHSGRVFLAGHGSGGTMAVRVAWNDPARFAGVASLNGPLPTRQSPLRRVNELRKLPCLLAMSRNSQAYPSARVCDDLRLLHAAGCTVALRQYPGADGLAKWMLADLDRWMMELVCGSCST
jgi:phospholipase/carboxylesterase